MFGLQQVNNQIARVQAQLQPATQLAQQFTQSARNLAYQAARMPGLFTQAAQQAYNDASRGVNSLGEMANTGIRSGREFVRVAPQYVTEVAQDAYKFTDQTAKYAFAFSTLISAYFAPSTFVLGLGIGLLLKYNAQNLTRSENPAVRIPADIYNSVSSSILFNAPLSVVGAINSMRTAGVNFNSYVGCAGCQSSAVSSGFNAFAFSLLSGIAVADMTFSLLQRDAAIEARAKAVPAN